MCRAGVSLDIVKRLLDTQQAFFSGGSIHLRKAARELTIRFLVERAYRDVSRWKNAFFGDWQAMSEALSESQINPVLISSLQEIQQRFFVDRDNINLQALCEELVQGWWRSGQGLGSARSMRTFHFLVKCRIAERLDVIRVRKWQMNITHLMEAFPCAYYNFTSAKFDAHCGIICSKLIMYEFARDASVLLELALWKWKIDETEGDPAEGLIREQCRINCGADFIIPSVLSYLIGNDEESISSGGD